MASTETSPETRQNNFEQSVAITLHLWPALSLAVQNNWGDGDASDKRDWLAGVIVDMFPSFIDLAKPQTTGASTTSTAKTTQPAVLEEPYLEDIEATLLQVMLDEFEVNVDDDTGFETAETIMRVRAQCAKDNFEEEVATLRRRFDAGKGKKVVMQQAQDPDQDTDWESDDDEEEDDGSDVDMDEAPALVKAPKEKQEPEIDEDGFEKVVRKKR